MTGGVAGMIVMGLAMLLMGGQHGGDGLDALRAVERVARWLLRPGGLVAVEHADVQGTAVFWIFAEEAGWRDTTNHKDLARKDRFVTAMWPGE